MADTPFLLQVMQEGVDCVDVSDDLKRDVFATLLPTAEVKETWSVPKGKVCWETSVDC